MKIIDKREIEFDAESIVRAITASLKAAQSFGLPGQAPAGVRFHPRESTIDVVYGTKLAPQAVSISSEALGAILVSYCIRVRIPMPRKAGKGIQIESNSVILAFKTTYNDAPATMVAETASRPAEAVAAWKWLQPEPALTDK
jgi:hypothetical protein